jgi:hypothetical protein
MQDKNWGPTFLVRQLAHVRPRFVRPVLSLPVRVDELPPALIRGILREPKTPQRWQIMAVVEC